MKGACKLRNANSPAAYPSSDRVSLENVIATQTSRHVRVIVVDQGSRPAPPIVSSTIEQEGSMQPIETKVLIIDHHQSTEWPDQSQHLTACQSPPISTSSLLAYLTCVPLHKSLRLRTDWLALVGIFGDLGSNEIRFGDRNGRWPATREMQQLGDAMKREGKKTINDAVSLLNAREIVHMTRKRSVHH